VANVLYRIGSITARHRLLAIGTWLVLAATAVVAVHTLGAKTNNALTLPGTDSQAAFDLLAEQFPPQQNGTNPFVLHVDQGTLSDPRYAPAVDATYKAIKGYPDVYSVRNPIGKNAEAAGIISADGKTGIMPVLLSVENGFITVELADKVVAATAPARKAGIDVAVGGTIGSVLSRPDTATSEKVGNITAMLILALVFGSLVAMGLPIVTAAFGLAITTSAIGLIGHLWSVPTVASTLAVMIGLGVGIDYALFLITKHQEQLADGIATRESIARSVASSGSAVVFAGGTVIIALASLVVAGIPLVTMLGFAAAIAVLMAVLTSITLLPAILSLVGNGVNRLRIPAFLRMRPRPPGQRRWDAWARWVTAHPWIAIAISAAILLPLIVPLFTLELGQPDVGVTPTSTTQRQAYDLITHGFGVGYNGPLLIALSLDPPAHPSAKYTKKYDRATQLQAQLEREQQELTAQKAELERQQRALEAQERKLRQQGAELRREKASLERQAAALQVERTALQRQAAQLEARALPLARQIAWIEGRLVIIRARERILEDRLAHTTDPDEWLRLFERLTRLREREAELRQQLAPLLVQARALARQARSLAAQAAELARQARALEAQEAELERQAAELERQGAELERQADNLREQARQLQARADRAERQKQQALKLKSELTDMLTAAGGNPDATDPRIVAIQGATASTSGVAALSPPQLNDDADAAIMGAIPRHAPSSDATASLVTVLREDTLPPETGANGVTAHVGGQTATYVDLARKIASKMPLVVLTVLALSFLFLLLAFRSLLVPLQAGLTNLLSVGAALGVLTAVFQWGWGLSAIGLDADTVPIASYVPLMMFAVLFGLSMDYEVFLVSRIQAHHDRGEEPRDAVTSGLGAAARVVTAAATIMFFVFASFVINGDPTIKQFGVGLSVAVLLAGTMVVLLAPALLSLFGRALFAVPRVLDRVLPHLDVEGTRATGAAEPVDVPEPDPEPERGRV
jgi:uncharacterized membrane protein YdfJ with MMPL/SSD domain